MGKVSHSSEYLRLHKEYMDTWAEYNRLSLQNDEVTIAVKLAKKEYDQAWRDFNDFALMENIKKIVKGKK